MQMQIETQKKKILFGGIIICIVVVIFGGVLMYQNVKNSGRYEVLKIDGGSVKAQTAGWKTYKDKWVSFLYPENLGSSFNSFAKGTPVVVVSPKKSDPKNPKIDSNGCYTGSMGDLRYVNGPAKFKLLSINGLHFCLTEDGDLSGGANYEGFYYTVYRAGHYYTARYMIKETVCRNNPADPESVKCMAMQQNPDAVLVPLVQTSVETFKFNYPGFVMTVMNLFGGGK